MSELTRIASIERGLTELKKGLIDLITMMRVLESDFVDLRIELAETTALPQRIIAPQGAEIAPTIEPGQLQAEPGQFVRSALGQAGHEALTRWRASGRVASDKPGAVEQRGLRARKAAAKAAGVPFARKRRTDIVPALRESPLPNQHWRGGVPPLIPNGAGHDEREEMLAEQAVTTPLAPEVPETAPQEPETVPDFIETAPEVAETAPEAPAPNEPQEDVHWRNRPCQYGMRGRVPAELLFGPLPAGYAGPPGRTPEEEANRQRYIKAVHNARFHAKKERQAASMRSEAAAGAPEQATSEQGMRRRTGMKSFGLNRAEKLARERMQLAEDKQMQRQRDDKKELVRETLSEWAARRRLRNQKGRHHKHSELVRETLSEWAARRRLRNQKGRHHKHSELV